MGCSFPSKIASLDDSLCVGMDSNLEHPEGHTLCVCGRPRKVVPYRGPTGSVSIMAQSEGIHPPFATQYFRRVVKTEESK